MRIPKTAIKIQCPIAARLFSQEESQAKPIHTHPCIISFTVKLLVGWIQCYAFGFCCGWKVEGAERSIRDVAAIWGVAYWRVSDVFFSARPKIEEYWRKGTDILKKEGFMCWNETQQKWKKFQKASKVVNYDYDYPLWTTVRKSCLKQCLKFNVLNSNRNFHEFFEFSIWYLRT